MAFRVRGLPSTWGGNVATDRAQRAPWVASTRTDAADRYPWGTGSRQDRAESWPWVAPTHRDNQDHLPWGVHQTSDTRPREYPWTQPTGRDAQDQLIWGIHAPRDTGPTRLPWGDTQATDTQDRLLWGSHAATDTQGRLLWGGNRPVDNQDQLPWGPGWRIHNFYAPNTPPSTEPITQWVIPIRSIYLVANAASLAINGVDLPALSAQVSIDVDSWAWRWSASIPGAEWSRVAAVGQDNVEVAITINGATWLGIAEQVSRSRRFGQSSVSVSGRGHAAWLASPYAPTSTRTNTEALTAIQLAEACLTENGVPIGWTITHGITDWLVPAGAWSHQGAPMDGVLRIAEAGGGYVQASPNLDSLAILPRYPYMPSAWSGVTPDVVLPTSAVTVDGIERRDKPGYDLVIVTGQSPGGIIGRVKKTGTAGALPAPTIVDALCTHVDAARQRGQSILGDTGQQYWVTITAPISGEIVQMQVGDYVQYDGAIGLVRSVQISANWSDGLVVRQTVQMETHQ